MFYIEDNVIHLTRGDFFYFSVSSKDRETGEKYIFQPGDVVRFSVCEKLEVEKLYLEKDFVVETPSEEVIMFFDESETKIGEYINKPTDYWYEVILNPDVKPQTILGYSEDGAAVLKLYPEHAEEGEGEAPETLPEDERVLDDELDELSERAIKNKAVARAVLALFNELAVIKARFDNYGTLKEGSTTGDAELLDLRIDADGNTYASAGEAVRTTVRNMRADAERIMEEYTSSEEIKEDIANRAVAIIDSGLQELLGTGEVE